MPSEGIQNAEGHLLHLLTLIQLRRGDCFLDGVTSVWRRLLATAEPPFLPNGPGGHRRGKSFHITDPDRSRQPHKRPAVIINSWTQVSRHELLHTDAAPVLEAQFLPCSRGTWGLDMTPFPAPRQTIEPWNKTGLNYFKLIQAIHHKSNINKALKRRLTETQGPEWMSAGEDVSSLIKPAESRWFMVAVNPIFLYVLHFSGQKLIEAASSSSLNIQQIESVKPLGASRRTDGCVLKDASV